MSHCILRNRLFLSHLRYITTTSTITVHVMITAIQPRKAAITGQGRALDEAPSEYGYMEGNAV